MRLIDADAIPYKKIMFDDDEDDFYYGVTQPYIDRMPTIDAVHVVRCKDCKYYQTGMFCEKWADLHPHAEEYPMVGSDGYCHYGEDGDGDG